ncbi:MAG: hypothetical protein HYV02_07080 [Deltaproteobacteria bacterium]|nr:hypothetical protein [Deltaproteobacteria bacterium]
MKVSQYRWSIPLVLIGLIGMGGCGGGSGSGSQPLGLFSTNASSGSAEEVNQAAWALAGSDMALGISQSSNLETSKSSDGNTQITTGKEALPVSPGLGLPLFFPAGVVVGKAGTSGIQCQLIDANDAECVGDAAGPLGGTLTVLISIHQTESSNTTFAGTVEATLTFLEYQFTDAECGEHNTISGVFGCTTTLRANAIEGTQAHVTIDAVCNTAQDADLLLDFVRGEASHQVGYDLGLHFEKSVDIFTPEPFNDDEWQVIGTVAVDGVNYSYDELQAVLATDRCE